MRRGWSSSTGPGITALRPSRLGPWEIKSRIDGEFEGKISGRITPCCFLWAHRECKLSSKAVVTVTKRLPEDPANATLEVSATG